MRIPLLSLFISSPFDGLQEHAEKVKECAWTFQQAIECYVSHKCQSFDALREEIAKMEQEADSIKRRIRGHIPKGTLMPVDKFQLFAYLKEQDKVLNSVEDTLDWISYRSEQGIPEIFQKDFFLLVDAVIDPIEELSLMVSEARKYFKNYSDKQRKVVKEIIRNLRRQEHDADIIEDDLKEKIFQNSTDPITVFHLVRLAETIGTVANHAEDAGDMMRAMIAR